MSPLRTLRWGALLLAPACARPTAVPSPPRPARPGEAAGRLEAGAGRADLTPPWTVPLAGYGARLGARLEAVHDRPAARALVLRDGAREVALVSLDLLVVPGSLRAAVLARLADLPLDGLLLASTHTHSGPGGYWDNWFAELAAMGSFDARWASLLADRIAGAVREARAGARPAGVRVARGEAPDLVRNRRFEDGAVDPALVAVAIEEDSGEPEPAAIAWIIAFGAHPTILGPSSRLLSGEFPGFARRALEAETGASVLFFNGAGGDLSPVVPGGGEDFAAARRTGEEIASRFLALRPGLSPPARGGLEVCERRFGLPPISTRGAVGPLLRVLFDPLARTFAPGETVVQAIRVGDVALAAFPCDLGAGLGLALRGSSGDGTLLLVSYANDYVGYVVDEGAFLRGGYEAAMSFYGRGLGDLFLAEARAALAATARGRSGSGSGSGGRAPRSRSPRRRGPGRESLSRGRGRGSGGRSPR